MRRRGRQTRHWLASVARLRTPKHTSGPHLPRMRLLPQGELSKTEGRVGAAERRRLLSYPRRRMVRAADREGDEARATPPPLEGVGLSIIPCVPPPVRGGGGGQQVVPKGDLPVKNKGAVSASRRHYAAIRVPSRVPPPRAKGGDHEASSAQAPSGGRPIQQPSLSRVGVSWRGDKAACREGQVGLPSPPVS